MIKAQDYFNEEHLTLPFIPQEDKSKIERFQEAVFGTKLDPHPLYDIEAYVREFLSRPVEDYVMLGFGGHGVSSRGIHYYAVKGNLALFIQLSYNSAATVDLEEARDRIEGIFQAIGYLFDAIKTAKEKGKISAERRLLVVESDFYGRGWGWIEDRPGEIDASKWHQNEPVLLSALQEIPGSGPE
ncbi:MAG: hypothetical protein JJU12_04855 [Chlamydiales bacterium]|nr:hypothetical protein [Chlamydiales bacterium]